MTVRAFALPSQLFALPSKLRPARLASVVVNVPLVPRGIRTDRRQSPLPLKLSADPPLASPIPDPSRATSFPEPQIDPSGPFGSLLCQTRPRTIGPPQLYPSAHRSRPALKSTLSFFYYPAFAAIIAIAAWASLDLLTSVDSNPEPIDTMTSSDVASPGHVGNLTPEQEAKLRQLWSALFKLCGVADPEANGVEAAQKPAAEPAPAPEDPESPQKRRFSLFRRKNTDSQPVNGADAKAAEVKDAADDNDKHGQTKQFQKILATQTPESIRETVYSTIKQDHPDSLVLRFLRARKWDVDKALIMLISAMSWRYTEMKVDSDIMKNGEAGAVRDEKDGSDETKKLATDFMEQSRVGKSFIHGTDKEGRPICVIRTRLHKPGAQSVESLERFTVYIIETTRLFLKPPVETATIIFDMTNFSLANMDYHPVKLLIQCFEANYPESLGAILVHNAPWVFQGIWRIIRGWLDPVVASKVHFTNYRAGLEEHIDASQIIKELDGDEDWEYKYVEPVEGENDAMKDTETTDRLIEERAKLFQEFETETKKWIKSPNSEEGKQAKAQREKLADQLKDRYWDLDPYTRSRSLYDRLGYLKQGGAVDWYSKGDKQEARENGAETQ
ncbi:hypothetical protein HIM_04277 [Hirsutella minnesotensis 3608]|uniref:CRAL-TRIO domain-containing protein n=1 Tax=Hirsutella minnesotensis 3608 TaxID=1043627 RepID=A0A0F7ZPW2_9HYPO|nr:hypothetical protein HIM_04277 [Hirsutella minnesotensis 3608]